MRLAGVEADRDAPAAPVVGVVLLATDLTTERDIRRIAPPDLAVCATRIAYDNPTTPENLCATLPRLAEAAALLVPGADLAAIVYGCTSAGIAIGHGRVAEAIGAARPGVPVVTPAEAAAHAFRALGARRIAVLTPYLPETANLVGRHFAEQGFEIARCTSLGLADDREMARLPASRIREAARRAADPSADALFVACTAFPATELVPDIEAETGRPVVTSNLAALWQALAITGRGPARPGLGRLLDLRAAEAA